MVKLYTISFSELFLCLLMLPRCFSSASYSAISKEKVISTHLALALHSLSRAHVPLYEVDFEYRKNYTQKVLVRVLTDA